jgi:4-methylaminobutanoate oxidase (formaldehyde-forming)
VLNGRGGYEADVTATRVRDDEWLVVTSAASPVRDADWLRRHVAPGWRVAVEDVTTAYAVFGVMGPRSRELLGGLTAADLGPQAFPFATSQVVDLGPARVRATRMTYVGELGWELTVPTELATGVWDRLVGNGAGLGLRLAGYSAINALRLDKGYRAFGPELGPDRSPVEAGLTFTCDLSGDRAFIGRDVVERHRADGPTRRLASFVVEDPEPVLWGGELLLRDGDPVGQVTSAAPSATLGATVGLTWVWQPDGGPVPREVLSAGGYEVDVGGARHPVRLSARSPHDPQNSHLHQ